MHWREKITGRPLALLALAAVAGIIIADTLSALHSLPVILCAAVLLAAWLTWSQNRFRWPVLLTVAVFALLHAIELRNTRLHPLRAALAQDGGSLNVEATGRVEQPLRRDLPGAEPGEAWFAAQEIRCPGRGRMWSGPTILQLMPGKDIGLPPGEYRIRGRLRLPSAPDNPGQFDARDYNLKLGLVAELWATSVECVREDRWSLPAALVGTAERCRTWVMEALSVDLADRPSERTIILAMALGAIEAGSKDLEKPFRESGTLHIFAVSGLHVAIVGAIFWGLLRPFGMRRSVMVAVLIPLLFGYAFITGLRPSAVRAALMAAVLLAGMGLNRRTDLLNSLGAAALLLLTSDTQQVFAPGFQLSFGVIAAIAVFVNCFTAPLRPWIDPDPFLPKPLLTNAQKSLWSGRRWFAGLFTVSAAATLGSLPLLFGHFHLVTPVSLLANAVLVPLSFLVLGTAILTLLCGALHVTILQIAFSNANIAFAWCALHAAQFFAGIPGGNFYLPDATPESRPPAELTILRLPAGAAAQHLRVGGRQWLLDTGAEEHFPFLVRPYLQHSGVNRLDGLILSHSDFEHIGAAVRMQREFGEPPTWEPGREPWRWETGDSSFRVLHRHGLQASPLSQGDTLDLGFFDGASAKATVLYPTDNIWPRRSDDRALVLRLDLGSFRVLWCNDAGFLAEKTMLETLPPEALHCDVLIRNQHSGDYSLLPEFLDATKPRIIVTSNDTFPPEQKFPPRIRLECDKRGIQLLDQRETGAVTLRIWPRRLEARPMRGSTADVLLPDSNH